MFAFLLPGCMIEEAQRTADAFLLSGVVSSKYCRQHHVIPEQANFRGHHELFCTIVFDWVDHEW